MDETLKKLQDQTSRMTWITIAAVTFVMVVALSMMVLTMWNTYRLGEQAINLRAVAVETHDALCAMYNREVREYAQTKDFIRDNPKGLLDSNGNIIISRSLLERGQEQREETINALRTAGLACTGEVIT